MISSLRRERHKIERNLGGVRNMDRIPGLLVIIDPKREAIAVREGVKLGIPTVAWIDTDADPDALDVVIPANDDAIGSVEVFLRTMADAVIEGRNRGGVAPPPRAAAEPEAEQKAEPAQGTGVQSAESAASDKTAEK
jgi:small subunit ribosomal protein S2